METLPDRLRWILAHRINPETGEPWREAKALNTAAKLKSDAYVGMVIRGDIKMPGPDKLDAIARVAPVSLAWLITGKGSPDDINDGPRLEREPQPTYSDGEAPFNFNLPNWNALALAALALPDAEGLPVCFVEIIGYDNGLLTGPLKPEGVLKSAKFTQQNRTPEEVEAMLVTLRAKHGRPPLRRPGADEGPRSRSKRGG